MAALFLSQTLASDFGAGAEQDDAGFLAFEEFFDNNTVTGVAKSIAGQHVEHGGFGLGHGRTLERFLTTGLLYGLPMAARLAIFSMWQ